MKVLITGVGGFIGYHVALQLLNQNHYVVGIDNLNSYYEVTLKEDRLGILDKKDGFRFFLGDISDKKFIMDLFQKEKFDVVLNLAAQAGVRYSIDNPDEYIKSNIIGFYNLLEACRYYPVEHLVYASSSSVYGANKKVPYSVEDRVDNPVSLYAATKKTDELLAYSYSKLYNIPTTGLRFFTVYGPFGRPDMAYFSFSKKILSGAPIKIFNQGELYRDFTYIDDIVQGVVLILQQSPLIDEEGVRYKLYNIGNSHPIRLMDFITILEECWGIEAQKEYLPMQLGDVYQTYADVSPLKKDFGFSPQTSLADGLKHFVVWYKSYYKV